MEIFLGVGVVVGLLLLSGVRVAKEYQRGVVFRLGRYVGTRGPGLYYVLPLWIESSYTRDIRTRTLAAERQGDDHTGQRDHPGQRGLVVPHRRRGQVDRGGGGCAGGGVSAGVDRPAQHHRAARPR